MNKTSRDFLHLVKLNNVLLQLSHYQNRVFGDLDYRPSETEKTFIQEIYNTSNQILQSFAQMEIEHKAVSKILEKGENKQWQ